MSSQHSTESDCDPLRRDHGCSRIYGNVDVIATLVSRSVIHIDCKSFNICACGFVSRPYMFIFDEILSHWGGYGLSGTWFQKGPGGSAELDPSKRFRPGPGLPFPGSLMTRIPGTGVFCIFLKSCVVLRRQSLNIEAECARRSCYHTTTICIARGTMDGVGDWRPMAPLRYCNMQCVRGTG